MIGVQVLAIPTNLRSDLKQIIGSYTTFLVSQVRNFTGVGSLSDYCLCRQMRGGFLFYFWRSWAFVNVFKAVTQTQRSGYGSLCIGEMAQRPSRSAVFLGSNECR